jgi:LysM repeat protein
MVVSVDSQKIIKNKRRYYSRKISKKPSSSYTVKRKVPGISLENSVSLYRVPYICALFIFSLYINLSDSYWHIRPPSFTSIEISLPEESGVPEFNDITLKASIALDPFLPVQQVKKDNRENAFYLSTYTIREDDRFSIIARKFEIDLDSLLSVNDISSGDTPVPGTEIKIPNISGIYYRVNKGDTLSSIAEKYDLEIENIREVNKLYSSVIHPGEKIYIPHGTMKKEDLDRIIGSKFQLPASGTVKNNYGSYIDPLTGLKVYNYGIDILNGKGTAVFAAKDGIVGNTSYNPYYGRVILINHSGSFQSMYGCLDRIVVEPGDHVLRGDIVGYIGNSGFKSGEHLQFSIFKNKEDVDTLEYLF